MFKPTVVKMIEKNGKMAQYHEINLCSECENAVWICSRNGTFPNAGTMQEIAQKFLNSLSPHTDPEKSAEGYFRCYCKVLHEYCGFLWLDEDEYPHVIESCDGFVEYSPENEPERPEPPWPGKRKRPAQAAEQQASAPDLQPEK